MGLLVLLNGVHGVPTLLNRWHMTIHNVDLFHLKIPIIHTHRMVIILHNKWLQEVIMAVLPICRVVLVVMITMVGKEVMHLIARSPSRIQLPFLGILQSLHKPLLGVHLPPRQITTMDSHMVQSMGINNHMPTQLLSRAMDMDMMTIMPQYSIPMEGTAILSLFTRRVACNLVIINISMVSHHMACQHKEHSPNLTVPLGRVNQGTYHLTKPKFHQLNHMVMYHIHSNTLMQQVEPCSKPILHMGQHRLLTAIISLHQHLLRVILNKLVRPFLVILSLVVNRPLVMGR